MKAILILIAIALLIALAAFSQQLAICFLAAALLASLNQPSWLISIGERSCLKIATKIALQPARFKDCEHGPIVSLQ